MAEQDPTTEPWVPPGGLLVHIGPHKTGTTTVQSAFAAARPQLAELGVLYPGTSPAPHGAVLARLGTFRGWDDEIPPGPRKHWRRLCEETAHADATVFVSSEALCHAGPQQAVNLCSELRPGAPVRVVITVRPLDRVLPSAWQEYVKSGWRTPYRDFLDWTLTQPRRAEGSPTPTFWLRHDHGRLARRWAHAVGPENVAVVVADPRRPGFVLECFEDLLGLPRGIARLDAGPSNRSLTAAETELLRAVNALAKGTVEWAPFNLLMRQGATPALVEERFPPPDEPRLELPTWARQRAQQLGEAAVDVIRASGVRVLGDLESLGRGADQGSHPTPDGHEEGVEGERSPVMPDHVATDAIDVLLSGLVRKVTRVVATAEGIDPEVDHAAHAELALTMRSQLLGERAERVAESDAEARPIADAAEQIAGALRAAADELVRREVPIRA